MYYVYVLKQIGKKHFYVGFTTNLKRRIKEHLTNKNVSTRSRRWELYCYFSFKNREVAENFERYLKTGSGRAFARKHFEFKVDEA